MTCPIELLSAQGYDLQFGVNVLGMVQRFFETKPVAEVSVSGHFYFTKLLLPVLAQAAKNSPDGHSRVVNTSSSAHELISTINFDTLKDSPARQKLGSWNLYFQSKLVSRGSPALLSCRLDVSTGQCRCIQRVREAISQPGDRIHIVEPR